MRILLIDKSDSELIEQALKQERIPLDRMQPSESDDSIVIPEDIYDAAILTASDIAYSRGARTCERITALREENAGVPLLVILPHPSAHDRANLLNAGADYVLSDPFADEELLATVTATDGVSGGGASGTGFGAWTRDGDSPWGGGFGKPGQGNDNGTPPTPPDGATGNPAGGDPGTPPEQSTNSGSAA